MNCTRWRALPSHWNYGRPSRRRRMNDVFESTMNRFSLCLFPLLLLSAGCFSAVDDEDYKAFTKDKWREMVKDNENRVKPEEQRPIQDLENPVRVIFRGM